MERESYLAGAMRNSTRLLVSRPISSWAAIGRAAPRPTMNMRVVLMPCWAKYTPTRWAMSFDNAFDAIEFCIASVYPAISINVAIYQATHCSLYLNKINKPFAIPTALQQASR